jgi:hypothetical protein
LDGPTLAKAYQAGSEDTIDYLERLLINVSVDATWAVNVVGVRPKPLPDGSRVPSANGKAPSEQSRR